MLSFQQLCVLSLAAATAFAAPSPALDARAKDAKCLDDSAARHVGTLWVQLIGSYSKELAETSITADYKDYSESALSLNAECPQVSGPSPPLLGPVFTNRTIFEEGQGSQPPIPSDILNIWHGCEDVTMRYKMNIGSGKRPVVGIITLKTVPAKAGNPNPYLISKTFSEFDSSAWVSNIKDAGLCHKPQGNGTTSANPTGPTGTARRH